MSSPNFPPLLAMILCLGIASANANNTSACSEADGWNTGRLGQAANSECAAEGYLEAHRLGEALAELRSRHADLDAQLAKEPERIGELRRQQRQIDVDIEAIHGVATLRGWPADLVSGAQP